MLLDAIDCRILAELQADASTPNNELADRIGLSPSPTLRRVRRLEDAGVIARRVAVVQPKRVGLDVTAFVTLTLTSQDPATIETVEDRLRGMQEVVEAHTLSGDDDYLLRVLVPSLEQYEVFVRSRLRTIPGLARIRTSFAYAAVKTAAPIVPRHCSSA